MERGSAKHGPRVDEELDHEVHQDASPDQDPVDSDLRLPPFELRAELARSVRPSSFPATGEVLVDDAVDLGASPEVLDLLRAVPAGRIYDNVEAVWADLGGEAATGN